MERRQFIQNCACGVCACTAIGPLASTATAAEEPKPQKDWRLGMAQNRYGKFLEILAAKMGEESLGATLQELGGYCGSRYKLADERRGDLEGFIRDFMKSSGEHISYDKEKGIVHIASPERTECACPLIDADKAPKIVCNCSLGWQKRIYNTVLGKEVQVTLVESVVRGGKRCRFEVRITDKPV